MKLILAIIIFFLAFQVQSQWILRQSGVTITLRQVAFYNQNTGWIAGDAGVLLKTTDGGMNWSPLSSGVTQDMYSIICTDSIHVYTCGAGGTILYSTNGGNTWLPAVSGTTVTLRSICWDPYATNFRAAGDNGVILNSSNNGQTWTSATSSTTTQLNCIIYFSGPSSGYSCEVMGNNGVKKHFSSSLWRVDEGYTSGADDLLGGVCVSRALFNPLAFMCSGTGKIYKRRGIQGNGWIQINSGVSTPLRSIADGNVSFGSYGRAGKYMWSVGDNGVIRYSMDTGSTWQAQTGGLGINLKSIAMVDTLRGCIVGENGTILQTNTGGLIGIQQISSTVPGNYQLGQNYPNPFNPVTNIEFSMPVQGYVKISVHDISGREIETIVGKNLSAGKYKADWDASKYSSGIYFYTILSGSYTETRKMILVK